MNVCPEKYELRWHSVTHSRGEWLIVAVTGSACWIVCNAPSIWSIMLFSDCLVYVGCWGFFFFSPVLYPFLEKVKQWWRGTTQAKALLHHFWQRGSPAERVCGMSALWHRGDANEQSLGWVCESFSAIYVTHLWSFHYTVAYVLIFAMSPHYPLLTSLKNCWSSQYYQSHGAVRVTYHTTLSVRCLFCMWLFVPQSGVYLYKE